MSFSTIQFHPGPRVASIVLNRPPLNIMNLQMLEELNAAWSEVEDLKAQVAVFSAAGDRAFSAGVDVADHAPDRIEGTLEKLHHVILRIRRSDCVSIAAIHGYTLGGGAELAMMCDLIIAADDARIGQPEIALGCYPPIAVAYLPSAIGFHKASEMILLGEPVSAPDAERFGLINKVVPRASLTQTVDGYIDKLLAKSSTVLALTKRALREGSGRHFEAALDRTHELYVRDLTKTEDMVEGMNAFFEKRPPNWKNR
jgi:cyclohexa-1,5-dienecarbonyl-CoA hydratase